MSVKCVNCLRRYKNVDKCKKNKNLNVGEKNTRYHILHGKIKINVELRLLCHWLNKVI